MNILVACNRFFLSGGPERYLFNILPALEKRGHKVIPFALAYSANVESRHSAYFPEHPVDGHYIHFANRPLTIMEKACLGKSVLFDAAVFRAAKEVIQKEKIQVVYALQIAHYLFPEIVIAARQARVPVVWRQSDYQLICPAYSAFRRGAPCRECDAGLLPAIYHRCLKGSLPISALRVLSMFHARLRSADRYPARLICPSRFLLERLKKAGYPHDKLVHLATPLSDRFRNAPPPPLPPPTSSSFVLYVGGLFPPKGVGVAVAAARGQPWKLVVAGDETTPEGSALRRALRDSGQQNVEFTGSVDDAKLIELYQSAAAVVIPSLWDENCPQVLLEAQALGKTVIASRIGSLAEAIRHGEDGLLFPPGDAKELARLIERVMGDPRLNRRLGLAARRRVRTEHRMEDHLEKLEGIFEEA